MNETLICEFCGKEVIRKKSHQRICGNPECKRKLSNKHSAEFNTEKRGIATIKEANEIRKSLGLKPLKSGRIRCLKCNRYFISWDVLKNRLCWSCAHGHETTPTKD